MAKESLSHTPRVALYARVSTANGQQDPELQLSELREYATRQLTGQKSPRSCESLSKSRLKLLRRVPCCSDAVFGPDAATTNI
jgi:predicted site-specific integrase-resolvase